MATTVLSNDLKVQKWLETYFAEYVRNSGFLPYMGRGTDSVIHIRNELVSSGQVVNIPLVSALSGAGVEGSNTLEGNEEQLGNFNFPITVRQLRNAVEITVEDRHYANIDLMEAARGQLRLWSMSRLRGDVIRALGSINGIAYGTATAAQRNTWSASNSDRVLYGSAVGNFTANAATTHANRLANIASTQKLSRGVVSLMKRIAKKASPAIRPMRVSDSAGREFFVMFADTFAFRDLKADLDTVNADARPRDVSANPIFQDGDLMYDGVVIREIPEIASLGGVGATQAVVSPVYLCGAQALGVAWAMKPNAIREDKDYGDKIGVGIREIRGVEKMRFETGNGGAFIDHGLVTGFVAAAGDA
jgi:N4-gp56 family major capsid protein